ncbi:MAG: type II toxin-antitoxin system VapC family toxin [Cyanobacteria bacterium J06592_8]
MRSGGEDFAEEVIQDLRSINVTIRDDLGIDFWQQAGKYKGTIKRISLADCFALALANREPGILITSDRKEFEPITSLNICQIDFIR